MPGAGGRLALELEARRTLEIAVGIGRHADLLIARQPGALGLEDLDLVGPRIVLHDDPHVGNRSTVARIAPNDIAGLHLIWATEVLLAVIGPVGLPVFCLSGNLQQPASC